MTNIKELYTERAHRSIIIEGSSIHMHKKDNKTPTNMKHTLAQLKRAKDCYFAHIGSFNIALSMVLDREGVIKLATTEKVQAKYGIMGFTIKDPVIYLSTPDHIVTQSSTAEDNPPAKKKKQATLPTA